MTYHFPSVRPCGFKTGRFFEKNTQPSMSVLLEFVNAKKTEVFYSQTFTIIRGEQGENVEMGLNLLAGRPSLAHVCMNFNHNACMMQKKNSEPMG